MVDWLFAPADVCHGQKFLMWDTVMFFLEGTLAIVKVLHSGIREQPPPSRNRCLTVAHVRVKDSAESLAFRSLPPPPSSLSPPGSTAQRLNGSTPQPVCYVCVWVSVPERRNGFPLFLAYKHH